MIKVRAAEGCRRPARILQGLLNERVGENGGIEAEVSYGLAMSRYSDMPILNWAAGQFNKYDQNVMMARYGVTVPEAMRKDRLLMLHGSAFLPPYLGRKYTHMGGTDIVVILSEQEAVDKAASYDFVTRYVPSIEEYRVWIYRRRHLGTYMKLLTRPAEYRQVGRNYDNGWSFRLAPSGFLPEIAREQAANAVRALELDFGAVDLLKEPNGSYRVLEVNTAPGVESDMRFSVVKLAEKIARWRELGYPRQNGT